MEFHPLAETIADVIAAGLQADLSGEEIAQDIIDRIDASKTYWVAPSRMPSWLNGILHTATWDKMRDACLAERKGEGR